MEESGAVAQTPKHTGSVTVWPAAALETDDVLLTEGSAATDSKPRVRGDSA